MAVNPTPYSRVSIGWWNSAKSLIDMDPADSGAVFSVKGPYVLDGAGTVGGAQTFSGAVAGTSTVSFNGAGTFQSTLSTRGTVTAATLLVQSAATFGSTASFQAGVTAQSTLTVRGQINADAGLQVGGGIVAQIISSATTQLSFGAIAPLESSSVLTVALSGVSRGDALFITMDPVWAITAANRDISVFVSSSSTAGEAQVWAINSTLTSVTPTANSIARLTRIKFGNFPAA